MAREREVASGQAENRQYLIYCLRDEGTSVRVMGEDMAQVMQSMGLDVELYDGASFKPFAGKRVICLREHLTSKILSTNRFNPMRRYVTLHTRHHTEIREADWYGMMMNFVKDKVGGQPVKMIAHSPRIYEVIQERLRKMLAPSAVRQILGNVPMIPYGVAPLFKSAGTNDRNVHVVPYNRPKGDRLKTHARVTLELQNMIGRTGQKVTTHFRHAPGYGPEKQPDTDYSLYTVEEQPKTRAEYVELAKTYGLAVSTSPDESFGLYYLELLLSGCLIVFLRAPWVSKLLPDYPAVTSMENLSTLAYNVWCDYEGWQMQIRQYVEEYVEPSYRLERFVGRMIDLIETGESHDK